MKLLLLLTISAVAVFAQPDSPVVTLSGADPAVGYQNIYTFLGTNITYRCRAASRQDVQTLPTVSAWTNANPTVLTITGHAFDYQSAATTLPVITITGGTGGSTIINGTFVFTPTGANTGSIAVDATAGGALAGTFVVTTRAPRTTGKYWSIIRYIEDANGSTIWSGWATDPTKVPTPGGSPGYSFACASRTSYGYE